MLSTPLVADYGPGPEGAAEGRSHAAQLEGQFALCASRRRLRAWPGGGGGGVCSWTGSLLSTPPAADFGPCPEEAAEGLQVLRRFSAGRGVCSLRLSPPTSGQARRRRPRDVQLRLDGEFAFYASRRRLRALPGGPPSLGGARSPCGGISRGREGLMGWWMAGF